MTLHNVHLYAVVRVKVCGIEADSHEEAITQAQRAVNLYTLLTRTLIDPDISEDELRAGVAAIEYADDIISALVDEHGDEEHVRSTVRHFDLEPRAPAGRTERQHSTANTASSSRTWDDLLKALNLLIDMADNHIEDIRSGLDEGLYSREDNLDLSTKEAALDTARQLLASSKQIAEALQDAVGALLACHEQMSQVEKLISDDDEAWHNAKADAREAYKAITRLESELGLTRSTTNDIDESPASEMSPS